MAVRLEPSEHAAWSAVLASSPWRSLAHWCREVVNDAVVRSVPLAGARHELADISGDELAVFVAVCAQLNERAKGSNRLGRVVADSLSAARAVVESAEAFVPVVEQRDVVRLDGGSRRTKLVNVRLSDAELTRWTEEAHRVGYGRVSTWVRHTVAALIGYEVAPVALTIPAGLSEVRSQLAGAVTNLAQLVDVAEGYDAGLTAELAAVHSRSVELLGRYHGLSRRT